MSGSKENKNLSVLYITAIFVIIAFFIWFMISYISNDSSKPIDLASTTTIDYILNNKTNASE